MSQIDSGALKPSVPTKAFYALGQLAQSAGFDGALPFTFFFYTAVLGLSGGLVGAALAISLAVDAVVDPIVGSWSDNIRSRLGRRLPLMLVAIPLMALGFGVVFMPPSGLSQTGLFLWLTATSIAVRSCVSLFNVPYVALGAELAEDYVERSRVVAYRSFVLIFGGVAVTALAYTVFFVGEEGLRRAAAYPGFGWSVGLLVAVGALLCCLGVRRYAASLPQPKTAPEPVLRRLPAELAEILRNSSFRQLFFSAVIFFTAVGLNASLTSHTYVFVWRVGPAVIQMVTYGYLLGIFAGVILTPLLSARLEKRTVVQAGLGLIVVALTVLPTLRALGLFAPTGEAALLPLALNVAVSGIGVGFASVAYPSMMADAADEHELKFGSRREGLYFAGLAFAGKAASGLGVLVGGVALDVIGFPAVAPQTATAIAEPLAAKLMFAYGPVAAALVTVSIVVSAGYAITRERHDRISADLRERRASAARSDAG